MNVLCPLPIPLEAVAAIAVGVGFFAWSVLWDDRRDERRLADVEQDDSEDAEVGHA